MKEEENEEEEEEEEGVLLFQREERKGARRSTHTHPPFINTHDSDSACHRCLMIRIKIITKIAHNKQTIHRVALADFWFSSARTS